MKGLRAGSVLFFVSGATGLAYEVIWFKRFTHVWGSSSLALAAVVASFLGGLALGAWLAGRFADRVRRPLFLYGALEVLVAILAVTVPWQLGPLRALAAHLPAHWSVQAVLTFAVIGPPTILMGATLPLLVRRFGRVGWLYGVNTAGAAAGCYAAGFHLLPAFGLDRTNLATAAVNLVVGLAAIGVARSLEPAPMVEAPARAPRRVLVATALAGAGALVLQIAWNRQLVLVLGGSTYAFTAVLTVVLLGIGIGGVLFEVVRPRRFGPLVVLLAAFAVTGRFTLEPMTGIVGEMRRLRTAPGVNATICLAAAAVLQLGACACMGMLFPAFVASARGRVGGVYAWNTLGAIAGAFLAALALLPWLGAEGALAAGLFAYALALVAVDPRPLPLALALLLVWPAARPTDPLVTNIGAYLFGPYAGEPGHRALFHADGAAASVLVRENPTGTRTLHVNGKPDASNSGDMAMQLGLAYVPRFLRSGARRVCVIGFGSGTTAGASLLFRDARVTCCEIEPAVVAAGRHFRDVNHAPTASDRFTLVLNDGRAHLQRTSETYDLILSEPSNPWMAGIGNLFTLEFYAAARARLAGGGLFAQWIQAYSLDPADYALIVRTMGRVFSHLALVRISDGDTILLGSAAPIAAALDRAVPPAVRADLETYFGTTDVHALLLEHLVLDNAAVRALAPADGPVNTDANLRLEYDAPLRLFRDREGLPVNDMVLAAIDGVTQASLLARWKSERAHLDGLARLCETLAEADRDPRAVVDAALASAPDHPWFLATRMIHVRAPNSFALRRDARRLASLSPDETLRAGRALSEAGEHIAAAVVFRVLSELRPTSAEVWARLALSEKIAGDPAAAERALRRAEELDPFSDTVRWVRDGWD